MVRHYFETGNARAPEQLFGGGAVTPAVDSWAAGIPAMALATGRVPWLAPDASPQATDAATLAGTLKPSAAIINGGLLLSWTVQGEVVVGSVDQISSITAR